MGTDNNTRISLAWEASVGRGKWDANPGGAPLCRDSDIASYTVTLWPALDGAEHEVTYGADILSADLPMPPGHYWVIIYSRENSSGGGVKSRAAVQYFHQPEPEPVPTVRAPSAPSVRSELTDRSAWSCVSPDPCELGARVRLSGTRGDDGNTEFEERNRGRWNRQDHGSSARRITRDSMTIAWEAGRTYEVRARRQRSSKWSPWSDWQTFRPFPTSSELGAINGPEAVQNFSASRQAGDSWRFQFNAPSYNGGLPIERFKWGWIDGTHGPCSGFLFGRRPIVINGEQSSYDFNQITMARTVDAVSLAAETAAGLGSCSVYHLAPIVKIVALGGSNPWLCTTETCVTRITFESVASQYGNATVIVSQILDSDGVSKAESNGVWILEPGVSYTAHDVKQTDDGVDSPVWDTVTFTTPSRGTRGRPDIRVRCTRNGVEGDCTN